MRTTRVDSVKLRDIAEEARIGTELLDILWSCYLLRHSSPNSEHPLENLKIMKVVHLLTQDVILRLCKFRDKNSRNLSFDQALKALRKKAPPTRPLTGIENRIKEYRQLTMNLDAHRDANVAHLSKRGPAHLKPPVQMFEAVRLAVAIVDDLSGARNQYGILDVDLRHEVLGEDSE